MATFNFKSSKIISKTVVSYNNILDVLGLVGGISKIFMVIGGLMVVYIADLKFKESLVNEFYSVIDPDKDILINRDFDKFLECKYDEFDIEVSKNNLSIYRKPDNLHNSLNKFFNKNKYLIVLSVFASQNSQTISSV